MIATPYYLGEGGRQFAFANWPESNRGVAAVILPPIGYEEVCSHHSLGLLAERFAARGIAAVRCEYTGTGNAHGALTDAGLVSSWPDEVRRVIADLRGAGYTHVVLVGLRFGATLAATLAADPQLADAAVLWDPLDSGRRFVRSLKLLSRDPDGVEEQEGAEVAVAGIEYSDELLDGLSQMRLDLEAVTVPALVVRRAEVLVAPSDEQPRSPSVESVALHGTAAMIDADAELSVVPTELLARIVSWVEQHAGTSATVSIGTPAGWSATSTEPVGDVVLRHEAVRIGAAEQLFGVVTVREDHRPDRAVMFLNNGVAANIGPGRAWITLARDIAATGCATLRLDISGLGDSPPRPGRPSAKGYPPMAGADIAAAVEYLHSIGIHRVAVVGLCSGAVSACDGVVESKAIEFVFGVNGRYDRPFAEPPADRRRRAANGTVRLLAVPLSKAPLFPFFDRVPTFVWRLLAYAHLVASPVVAIEKATKNGARLVLLFGDNEWGLRSLRRRDPSHWNALLRSGAVVEEHVDGLDHSMFRLAARRRVSALLMQHLATSFAGTNAPAVTSPPSSSPNALEQS